MNKTYLKWLASAKLVSDLGKEVSDETFNGMMGLVFEDGAYIEIRTELISESGMAHLENKFGCVTGREEVESENLFEVVDFLWYTHSMNS